MIPEGYKLTVYETVSTSDTVLYLIINHFRKDAIQSIVTTVSLLKFLGRIPKKEERFKLPYFVDEVECELV